MRLHQIPDSNGATHPRKRLGIGEGGGHGKTAGRGQKGSKARSGYSIRPGFEGGQMPLYRKLPQRGFSNFRFSNDFAIVNLSDIVRVSERVKGAEVICAKVMASVGIIRNANMPVKVLGNGDIASPLKIKAAKFSASAKSKIEAAGGQAISE